VKLFDLRLERFRLQGRRYGSREHGKRRVARYTMPLVFGALGLGAAACTSGTLSSGGNPKSGTLDTSGLTSVTVKSSNPSLPPVPGDSSDVTTYTSPSALAVIRHLIKSDNIALRRGSPSSGGCTGGAVITIVLKRSGGVSVTINAYSCGGTVTGNISGKTAAFIHSMEAGP
jgi:hypothetical protein